MTEIENIKNKLAADIDALRSRRGYLRAGIPNYFHLFGRDACVSALQLLDYDPAIARNTLENLARYQAKRRGLRNEAFAGKILHEHFPGGPWQKISAFFGASDKLRKLYIFLLWKFPYYGTVDGGAWFIMLLHRYFKKTGDEEFLRSMWPVALKIVKWLDKRAADRQSGLIMYRHEYAFGLKNQSWKDTVGSALEPPIAVIEVQGYYFEAYNCLAELARDVFGDEARAEQFARKAKQLKSSFNKFFWREETGYAFLTVNSSSGRDDTVASNPGHLLFTGILSDKQIKSVVQRVTSDELWTPYGVRTLSTNDEHFNAESYQQGSVWPFDNWVIYQGLLKNGYQKEAEHIKNGLIKVHGTLGGIPELFTVSKDGTLAPYPEACDIQAWSAGALMDMITSQRPVL